MYDTTTAFGVPDYTQGVWALNSPNELYSVMHDDLGMNLYIADVDGSTSVISSNGLGTATSCL